LLIEKRVYLEVLRKRWCRLCPWKRHRFCSSCFCSCFSPLDWSHGEAAQRKVSSCCCCCYFLKYRLMVALF